MIPIQLEFFKSPEQCEIDALRKVILDVKTSSDKVRRGMYAKLSELTKQNNDLKARLEVLEAYLCKEKQ
jgi:hypothetical protein